MNLEETVDYLSEELNIERSAVDHDGWRPLNAPATYGIREDRHRSSET